MSTTSKPLATSLVFIGISLLVYCAINVSSVDESVETETTGLEPTIAEETTGGSDPSSDNVETENETRRARQGQTTPTRRARTRRPRRTLFPRRTRRPRRTKRPRTRRPGGVATSPLCGSAPLNPLSSNNRKRMASTGGGNFTLPAPYIVNGRSTTYGHYPSYVQLRMGSNQCGGVLISRQHVLTAGHCMFITDANTRPVVITKVSMSETRATLGEWSLISRDAHERSYGARKTCLAPNFRMETNAVVRNDFAILTLDQEVELSDHVQPACLADKTTQLDLSTCHLVGSGFSRMTRDYGILPTIVQTMPVKELFSCGFMFVDRSSNSCWSKKNGRGIACMGDSGGPILCLDKNREHWYVVAITSYGDAECRPDRPSVYADLRKFGNTINKACRKAD